MDEMQGRVGFTGLFVRHTRMGCRSFTLVQYGSVKSVWGVSYFHAFVVNSVCSISFSSSFLFLRLTHAAQCCRVANFNQKWRNDTALLKSRLLARTPLHLRFLW